MNQWRRVALLVTALAAILVSACGSQRVQTPQRPGQDLIVLLPDAESGGTGRAEVSNPSGSVGLLVARDSTLVAPNQAPAPVTPLSEAEVDRIFGDALSALPPPPERFTLFFRFESDELTDESRALLPKVLMALTERPNPDVVVIGHTDTTGTSATNFDLGLKRAMTVRDLLTEAGVGSSVIEVVSHGELDLLFVTADEVAEPRNRRVDIAVR
jgi:outer membrane protein OmpA-like peptidoglycan-associated protein